MYINSIISDHIYSVMLACKQLSSLSLLGQAHVCPYMCTNYTLSLWMQRSKRVGPLTLEDDCGSRNPHNHNGVSPIGSVYGGYFWKNKVVSERA